MKISTAVSSSREISRHGVQPPPPSPLVPDRKQSFEFDSVLITNEARYNDFLETLLLWIRKKKIFETNIFDKSLQPFFLITKDD